MTLPVRFSFRYFFLTDVFGWVGARSDVGPVVERCTMGPKDLGSNPSEIQFIFSVFFPLMISLKIGCCYFLVSGSQYRNAGSSGRAMYSEFKRPQFISHRQMSFFLPLLNK